MPPRDCEKYEDFLPIIGEFGAFQKRLLVCMMPAALILSFNYFGQIFMILMPKHHWCRIPELENLPMKEQLKRGIPIKNDDQFETCFMYDVPFESDKSDNVTRTKIPCNNGWIYDREAIPYESIAIEYNWVCDSKELSTYSVITFFMGSIVGCLLFGYVTDHWGRLVALFLSNICAMVGGCISALCKDFYCFAVSRFVAGLALNTCFIALFILALENVGIKYRTLVGNLPLTIFFTLGACTLPWVAYACGNWRYYTMAITLPVVLMILMSWLLPESPSWLVSVGKIKRAIQVLKEAAKTNGKTISEEQWSDMQQCFELKFLDEQSNKQYTCLDLFKTLRRAVVMIILIITWMIAALVYDAHVRVVDLLDTDVFITFTVASLVELPAGIVPILLLDRVGRKPTMIASMLLCASCSLFAGLLKGQWNVTIAALCARFFVCIVYNVGQQWASEILPTVLRGQGLAVINVMGQVGALISPIVIYTHHFYHSLPMFIIAFLSLIGAVVIVVLPETRNTVLPHTLEEAEKRWTLSCRKQIIKADQ
ncbi:solute carrier family 22 member 7 [Drosophila takahashii]|uniref:solute carrier family 22 member 7 n=1 Tax=Drosophila takahashii TaxID=29030 RepID=UPI001CF82930|nr:solute carrier family 22 member 7 [Drosophila takahashii]